MRISVIVPTVAGRERHLVRCRAAYRERSVHDIEFIVEDDHPTCGLAWNAGAARASGDYLHFTADDLEPQMAWDHDAVALSDMGLIPAPTAVIDLTDESQSRYAEPGQPISGYNADISVVPFCSRRQWVDIGSFLPCHYFTDSYFCHRAVTHGYPIVACQGYEFLHHVAAPGRGAGMTVEERMEHDQAIYNEAVRL